jgi:hypothetical protein
MATAGPTPWRSPSGLPYPAAIARRGSGPPRGRANGPRADRARAVSYPGASTRLRGDHGQAGGLEALPFGVLVFVVGALLVANAWAVIDAKFAVDAAAREAVRTFVEAPADSSDPIGRAKGAGLDALAGHGRDPTRATVRPVGDVVLERCARVTFEAIYEVPALALPIVGGYGPGAFRVRATSTELVDPFRDGLHGEADRCL